MHSSQPHRASYLETFTSDSIFRGVGEIEDLDGNCDQGKFGTYKPSVIQALDSGYPKKCLAKTLAGAPPKKNHGLAKKFTLE